MSGQTSGHSAEVATPGYMLSVVTDGNGSRDLESTYNIRIPHTGMNPRGGLNLYTAFRALRAPPFTRKNSNSNGVLIPLKFSF